MKSVYGSAAWKQAWGVVKRMWKPDEVPIDMEAELTALREKVPAPVFWLFGKTQSGKTSLIRYLTGAEDAAIGSGFRPCTKTSRTYPFPTADVPVMTFLDTRGVDEPGYDPAEDITAFDQQAHLMVVTSRVTDFATGNVRQALEKVRNANAHRPVVLALTCLHEVNPTEQHPQPYPFDPLAGRRPATTGDVPAAWARLIAQQADEFGDLVDRVVPIDLTRPEEGYADPNYGGEALKRALLDALPGAYRTTFAHITEVTTTLKDAYLRHAIPVIVGYSTLAASAGAIPVPFLDLVLLPGIQARMVRDLGKLYGQPLTAARFMELAASMGMGLAARQAIREVVKFIPFVGSAAGAALAGASTFALGRAFCEYYEVVHQGHVPNPQALKKLYQDQLLAAEKAWFTTR
jgi:uncharacterized protein (DUF697 family)/predicted GTPase